MAYFREFPLYSKRRNLWGIVTFRELIRVNRYVTLYRYKGLFRATREGFRYGCFFIIRGTSIPRHVRYTLVGITNLSYFYNTIYARRVTFLRVRVRHDAVVNTTVTTTRSLQRGTTLTRNTRFGRNLSRPRVHFTLTSRVRAIRRRPGLPLYLLPNKQGNRYRFDRVRNGTRTLGTKQSTIGSVFRFYFPRDMRITTQRRYRLKMTRRPTHTRRLTLRPRTTLHYYQSRTRFQYRSHRGTIQFLVTNLLRRRAHNCGNFRFLNPLPKLLPTTIICGQSGRRYFPYERAPTDLLIRPFTTPLPYCK